MSQSSRQSPSEAITALVDLLNSRAHAGLPDRLGDNAFAEGFIRTLKLPARETHGKDVIGLRAFRDAVLVAVGPSRNESAVDGWRQISNLSSDVTLRYAFGEGGTPVLETAIGNPALGAMLQAVARIVDAGAWPRIKICANDACEGVFFDDTRNRSQKWHSYETCGNRINVAAHRARKSATQQSA
jgi:predicted RNA-binding Zn ribbon-like protein